MPLNQNDIEKAEGRPFAFPGSGALLGRIADVMRVKRALYVGKVEKSSHCADDADYKRAQRYFAGKRIEPEQVAGCVNKLVDGTIPVQLRWTELGGEGGSVAYLARMVVEVESIHWDRVAAQLNTIRYPAERPVDATYTALRFAAWDNGIRLGAFLAIRHVLTEKEPDFETLRIDDRALATWIDSRIEARGGSVRQLVRQARLPKSVLQAWRSGASLPQTRHIERLAQALVLDGEDPALLTLQLRLLVGLIDIRRSFAALVNGDLDAPDLSELLDATLDLARHAYRWFRRPEPNGPLLSMDLDAVTQQIHREQTMPQWLPVLLAEVVAKGAGSPGGAECARHLASLARGRPHVAADLMALAGDWSRRIGYWRYRMVRHRQSLRFIDGLPEEIGGASRKHVRQYYQARFARDTRMTAFWRPIPMDPAAAQVLDTDVPELRARFIADDALEAFSVHDYDAQFPLLVEAVRLDPKNAGYRFKLALELHRRARLTGNADYSAAAVAEMQAGLRLEPWDVTHCIYYGLILRELKRFDESRAWFEAAEASCAGRAGYWVARAKTDVAREDYELAEKHCRTALRIQPDELDAKALLAAVLMAQGKEHEAIILGKDVQHVVHANPSSDWKQIVAASKGERP